MTAPRRALLDRRGPRRPKTIRWSPISHAFSEKNRAPKLSSIAGPIRRGYARSDRRPANCFNPQLRASSDATAHVGVWSAREGSGADASMVAIDR